MLYSDTDIQTAMRDGCIKLSGWPDDGSYPPQLQPASVDLRFDISAVKSVSGGYTVIGDSLEMLAGTVVLAATREIVSLDRCVAARVEGKSSWARKGLLVHCTAGFIDPGFDGVITLEMKNLTSHRIRILDGCFISQICFQGLKTPARFGYSGSYQGARTSQYSKFDIDAPFSS